MSAPYIVTISSEKGGVGKTTIAAALGIAAAARQKGRVLVLTVDPARRLATALGVDEFGNADNSNGREFAYVPIVAGVHETA